jgi:hypothetical protein
LANELERGILADRGLDKVSSRKAGRSSLALAGRECIRAASIQTCGVGEGSGWFFLRRRMATGIPAGNWTGSKSPKEIGTSFFFIGFRSLIHIFVLAVILPFPEAARLLGRGA